MATRYYSSLSSSYHEKPSILLTAIIVFPKVTLLQDIRLCMLEEWLFWPQRIVRLCNKDTNAMVSTSFLIFEMNCFHKSVQRLYNTLPEHWQSRRWTVSFFEQSTFAIMPTTSTDHSRISLLNRPSLGHFGMRQKLFTGYLPGRATHKIPARTRRNISMMTDSGHAIPANAKL